MTPASDRDRPEGRTVPRGPGKNTAGSGAPRPQEPALRGALGKARISIAGAGSVAVARSLARALGNRALGLLATAPGLDVSREQGSDTIRRTPGGGSGLTVVLSMSESASQYYDVDGATMEEVDRQLPGTLGEYRHDSVCNLTTQTSEEGESTVIRVAIPVTYYYVMPRWTRLGEQSEVVQAAWRRFYNDLMTHEREHMSVSRREYNTLRDTLRALPAEERSESNVMSVFDTGIETQNDIHENHTGFTTPATLVFSDYIPPPAPPAAVDAAPGTLEGEE